MSLGMANRRCDLSKMCPGFAWHCCKAVAQPLNTHAGALQAKEVRRVATELVRRISLLKGCLPSCSGYTGKQLVEAAGRLSSVAGTLRNNHEKVSGIAKLGPEAVEVRRPEESSSLQTRWLSGVAWARFLLSYKPSTGTRLGCAPTTQ